MLNTFENPESTYINKVLPQEVGLICATESMIAGLIQRICTTQFADPTLTRNSEKYKRLN